MYNASPVTFGKYLTQGLSLARSSMVDFHTGVEYLVLPSLLKTGASRSLDMLTLEKHRAKKVCPLHFLDVVVSHAQCKAMGLTRLL